MLDELYGRTSAFAMDSHGRDHMIPVGLRYSRNGHPFEIGFEFTMVMGTKTVYASRDILRQGLWIPSGKEQVRAQPCKIRATMSEGVMITLPMEFGRFDIVMHHDIMKDFIWRTYEILPRRNEDVYFDLEVDAAIEKILADT